MSDQIDSWAVDGLGEGNDKVEFMGPDLVYC